MKTRCSKMRERILNNGGKVIDSDAAFSESLNTVLCGLVTMVESCNKLGKYNFSIIRYIIQRKNKYSKLSFIWL